MSKKITTPAPRPTDTNKARPVWTRLGSGKLAVRTGITAGRGEQEKKLAGI